MAQRFEGHNLEDALQSAAVALGVDRPRVKYRVLAEKRGFLGGVKRIVIEAEAGEAPSTAVPAAPPVLASGGFERAPSDRPARSSRPSRGGRGGRESDRGRGRRGGEREREGGPRRDFRKSIEAPEQEPRSDFAKRVADWFDEIGSLADLDLTVRTVERDEAVDVMLFGRDARYFVDHNGEGLDALQTLANKAFREQEKLVDVDALEFKKERARELESRARELADLVRDGGSEQQLPPMPPGERRIVHLALADDADVTTESRGEGYFKRVVILRREASVPAE